MPFLAEMCSGRASDMSPVAAVSGSRQPRDPCEPWPGSGRLAPQTGRFPSVLSLGLGVCP